MRILDVPICASAMAIMLLANCTGSEIPGTPVPTDRAAIFNLPEGCQLRVGEGGMQSCRIVSSKTDLPIWIILSDARQIYPDFMVEGDTSPLQWQRAATNLSQIVTRENQGPSTVILSPVTRNVARTELPQGAEACERFQHVLRFDDGNRVDVDAIACVRPMPESGEMQVTALQVFGADPTTRDELIRSLRYP